MENLDSLCKDAEETMVALHNLLVNGNVLLHGSHNTQPCSIVSPLTLLPRHFSIRKGTLRN